MTKCFLTTPIIGLSVAFEETPQVIYVTPSSVAGSVVATVNIVVDEMILNTGSSLSLYNLDGFPVIQNSSGLLVPSWHTLHPNFRLVPSDNSSHPTYSSSYHLFFNASALAELREQSQEYCTIESKHYTVISLDLLLLSDSYYHLGDHTIFIEGGLRSNSSTQYFQTLLQLRVQAGRVILVNYTTTVIHAYPSSL